MKNFKIMIQELHTFLLLWFTQSFSSLGSRMTSYALVIWSYQQEGKALTTSFLMVCSYTPYIILSIFAGALSDRWNKKRIMLVCDTIAAATTIVVLVLLLNGKLQIWHIYVINFINGLMNTVQQPASEVAVTRILPEKYYQKVGGLRYLSNSVNTILTPIIATAFLAFAGMTSVIIFDLVTFVVAFLTLLLAIRIPKSNQTVKKKDNVLKEAKIGFQYLKKNRGILDLIIFLSMINFSASMYDAIVPAMMLSRNGGSEEALGIVNATVGITTFLGSIFASFTKTPKSRVRVICNSLLLSMGIENILLAFGQSMPVWCIGAFFGWIAIPLMSTNYEAIMRLKVPVDIQGRVFSTRNTLQYFTIPIGYFIGGFLVDKILEPFMAKQSGNSIFIRLFGAGKGSGAAIMFLIIAIFGMTTCLYFRRDKNIWALEKEEKCDKVVS